MIKIIPARDLSEFEYQFGPRRHHSGTAIEPGNAAKDEGSIGPARVKPVHVSQMQFRCPIRRFQRNRDFGKINAVGALICNSR